MFNLRPEDLFPWLRVEPPPADEVPGFNLNPDGSAGDTRRSAASGASGFAPSASASPPMGTGFQDAMRFAPGNIYPTAYLPNGLPDFGPPPRHPLQDALDEIMRIYSGSAPKPSNPLIQQGPGTGVVSPMPGPPLSRYTAESQPSGPATPNLSAQPRERVDQPATESPPGFSSFNFAQLDPTPAPPPAPGNQGVPEGQGRSLPWLQINPPDYFNSDPLLGRGAARAEPVSLPSSTTDDLNTSTVSNSDAGAGPTPANDVQVAQVRPSSTPQQPRNPNPSVNPNLQKPASELRLQVQATQRLDTQLARTDAWEKIIRQPLPETLPPRMQKPLPSDWEGTLTKINPDYLKWTKAAAEKHSVPPELLARLFYRESDYNKNRVSGAGARGIAQLMPIAVKALGLDPNTFDYFDAEKSINAGAAILANYYGEFKDWPKAVAAYNMGNTAVNSWLAGDQSRGPNGETQDMLKYVFRGDPYAFGRKQ